MKGLISIRYTEPCFQWSFLPLQRLSRMTATISKPIPKPQKAYIVCLQMKPARFHLSWLHLTFGLHGDYAQTTVLIILPLDGAKGLQMKSICSKTGFCLSLAGILYLFLTFGVSAQQGKGAWGGWGPGSRYGGVYNPQAVETVQGEVEKVERFSSGKGKSAGVRIIVKTGTETMPVVLGPAWFVEQQALKLAAGDRVEITGSRSPGRETTIFIAGEVKKGNQVLRLRDAEGIPVWAGQKWRQRR